MGGWRREESTCRFECLKLVECVIYLNLLCQVLGIEAARSVISLEIKYIMSQYGIKVRNKAIMFLSSSIFD